MIISVKNNVTMLQFRHLFVVDNVLVQEIQLYLVLGQSYLYGLSVLPCGFILASVWEEQGALAMEHAIFHLTIIVCLRREVIHTFPFQSVKFKIS